jgi:hypothetical protein
VRTGVRAQFGQMRVLEMVTQQRECAKASESTAQERLR